MSRVAIVQHRLQGGARTSFSAEEIQRKYWPSPVIEVLRAVYAGEPCPRSLEWLPTHADIMYKTFLCQPQTTACRKHSGVALTRALITRQNVNYMPIPSPGNEVATPESNLDVILLAAGVECELQMKSLL